ncbi:hypothetical protein ABT56_09845 [Photobacterium aquae]|uniref:Uncharacterized protein n=1 Tax=Photobacterium aquae TaxID=1195763 RepID=A0A0J1H2N2_9GAMM|nr:hypothetical protein ABT56_09845 [Photobacterium aquae]
MALNKFINLTLGEILGVNYIVDQSLADNTQPVTLHISEPVNPGRMLGLVEEVLRLSDVALLQDKGLIKVVPLSKATNLSPEIVERNMKRLLRYGQVIEFVPVNHLPLGQASQLAMTFVTQGKGRVLSQAHLNSLILVGEQQDIARFRELFTLIDVPSPVSNFTTIVTPAFISADELVVNVNQTLPLQGVPVVNTQVSEKGLVSQSGVTGVSITPIGDSNRILLTASSRSWLDFTKQWIRQLDRPKQTVAGEMNIFTYFMQNAQAQDITDVINQVFGNSSGAGVSTNKAETKKTESAVRPATLAGSGSSLDKSKSSSLSAVTVGNDKFKIVVDETRNALIFMGTYDEYARVVELLKVLDRRPRQVLIEASVMEVTLDDSLDLGVNWNVKNGNVDGGKINGGTSGEGGIKLAAGGLLLNGTFGDFTANLSAAAKDGKVHILSSPRLLAKDGEEAKISVGTQIAVKTGSVTSGESNGSVTDSFTYVDTGVILELMPTINENGLVELAVSQEVSEAGESEGNTPPILKRHVETVLVAETGQTIVLGGLISQNQSSTVTKVPLLGDIPVLGHLFKATNVKDRKTELIITITPHIIYNRSDADFYTQEFRSLFGWDLVPPQVGIEL